jgi:hypothetical protein
MGSRQYAWQQRMQEAGRCVDCGEPRHGVSKRYCAACKAKRRAWKQKAKAKERESV